MKKLAIIISFVLFTFAFPASATQPVVKEMHFQAIDNAFTLVLGLTLPVQPKIFPLHNPDRLIIDLQNASLDGTVPSVPTDAYFIHGIRTGSLGGQGLRVVLDLDQPTEVNDFWLTSDKRIGHRLVVDLKTHGHAPAKYHQLQAKSVTPAEPLLAPKLASRVVFTNADSYRHNSYVTPVIKPITADTASRSITPITTPSQPVFHNDTAQIAPSARNVTWSQPKYYQGRDLIVAIDPGHGGKDTGARGYGGTCEKDVVLAIAKRLANRINAESGMKAVLTRATDIFIPLHQRVVKARQAHADLFISIHADASPNNSEAQGASVFTLSERGASSTAARLIAANENAADLIGGVSIEDKDHTLASVLLDMSIAANMEAGRRAAEDVLGRLYQIGEIHKENVQYAGFAVLKAPDVPGMLVETAYISNPEEEHKLRSPEYQERLAGAVFDGISEYFRTRPPVGTRMAQAVTQQRLYPGGGH